jgi:hypothetical protein
MQWVGDAIELCGLGVEGTKTTVAEIWGFAVSAGFRAFWISRCILMGAVVWSM